MTLNIVNNGEAKARLAEILRRGGAGRDDHPVAEYSCFSVVRIRTRQTLSQGSSRHPAGRQGLLQRERHDVLSLRLDEEAIERLTELPDIHADPFDRMLICQTLSHSMQLVTSDRHMRAYPVPIFWD